MREDGLSVEPEDPKLGGERHAALRVSADDRERDVLSKHQSFVQVFTLKFEEAAHHALERVTIARGWDEAGFGPIVLLRLHVVFDDERTVPERGEQLGDAIEIRRSAQREPDGARSVALDPLVAVGEVVAGAVGGRVVDQRSSLEPRARDTSTRTGRA